MAERHFDYELRIRGRLTAADRPAAEQKIKAFTSLSINLHDTVDDITIDIRPDPFEEMREILK